jgi:hypothetical protein
VTMPEHITKNIMQVDDGEFVYWPFGSGFYTSLNLREIADELDLRNGASEMAQMDRDLEADIEWHRKAYGLDDGCCSGSSPCSCKQPDPPPILTRKEGALFCPYCHSRLNKRTPAVCPDCNKELQ